LPLVGIGLLYQKGRFRQHISARGWQQESYPINDFSNMPLQLERSADGEPIMVEVEYRRRVVAAQVWRAQVGRVPLYLLDTNLHVNHPEDRVITGQLYGGGADMRIRQEIMLGIGGMRALRALDIHPTVCHMNEGHAAFLSIERLRMAMQEEHLSFEQAREVTSTGNVFTTHTSVPAGIDRFPPHLIDQYLSAYYSAPDLSREAFLRLGQSPLSRPNDKFSMAVLALHLSKTANGVSASHGQVSREMWKDLWPETPADQVPITSVTNGIHPQSWVSPDLADLLSRYAGARCVLIWWTW